MTKECEGHEDDSLMPYPETSADDARFQSNPDTGVDNIIFRQQPLERCVCQVEFQAPFHVKCFTAFSLDHKLSLRIKSN